MVTNKYGQCVLDRSDIVEALYHNLPLDNVLVAQSIAEEHNGAVEAFKLDYRALLSTNKQDISIEEFDKEQQKNWYIPQEYLDMDIEQYIKNLVKTPEERTRVEYEMQLYKEFGLQNVLKVLKYIIDLMRKNNIVWGVGRGSSVSSYVLFLMGVHKVDSMKYNLDIKDFLK